MIAKLAFEENPATVESPSPKGPRSRRAPGLRTRVRSALAYQTQALESDDPGRASLGCLCGDLMIEATILGGHIRRSLQATPLEAESVQRTLPLMDVQLRLARQIDRFMQFDRQASAKQTDQPHPEK